MLYGGQAGGGKSLLARALALTVMSVWPNAVVGLFRRTYPELEDSHIRPIQREVAGTAFTWHEGRRELSAPNGAVCLFRYCDNREDLGHYQSRRVRRAHHRREHPLPRRLDRVPPRPRQEHPARGGAPSSSTPPTPGASPTPTTRSSSSTPTPPAPSGWPTTRTAGLRRVFHQAKLEDNPALAKEYRRRLLGIKDEQLRSALLHGDWNTLGAQFFPEWNKDTHTVPAFRIPPTWRERVIGVDFGYGAPWSLPLLRPGRRPLEGGARRPGGTSTASGTRRACATMSRPPGSQTWCSGTRTWGRGVQLDRPGSPCSATPPSGPSSRTGSLWLMSTSEPWAEVGVDPQPANNDRLSGWSRVRDYFAPLADGYPAVVYMDCCPQAIATIPALQRSNRDPEDADTRGDDHACDELRYVCHGPGRPDTGAGHPGARHPHRLAAGQRPPTGCPRVDDAGQEPAPQRQAPGARLRLPRPPAVPRGRHRPPLLSAQQQAHMARFNMAMRAARGMPVRRPVTSRRRS